MILPQVLLKGAWELFTREFATLGQLALVAHAPVLVWSAVRGQVHWATMPLPPEWGLDKGWEFDPTLAMEFGVGAVSSVLSLALLVPAVAALGQGGTDAWGRAGRGVGVRVLGVLVAFVLMALALALAIAPMGLLAMVGTAVKPLAPFLDLVSMLYLFFPLMVGVRLYPGLIAQAMDGGWPWVNLRQGFRFTHGQAGSASFVVLMSLMVSLPLVMIGMVFGNLPYTQLLVNLLDAVLQPFIVAMGVLFVLQAKAIAAMPPMAEPTSDDPSNNPS